MIMRLTIDALSHEIDSTDPELLGKWIVEIFGRIPKIYPATRIELEVRPSFMPTGDDGRPWAPDWIADSRVIGQIRPIRSPRDLVGALSAQLDELEMMSHG